MPEISKRKVKVPALDLFTADAINDLRMSCELSVSLVLSKQSKSAFLEVTEGPQSFDAEFPLFVTKYQKQGTQGKGGASQ